VADESLTKFQKVGESNCVENTRRFMVYLGCLRDFFGEGNSMFSQMKVHLEKIEGTADRRKRDRSGTIDSIKPAVFADTSRLTQAYDDIVDNLSQPRLVILHAVESAVPPDDFETIVFHLARIHHKKGTGVEAIKALIELDLTSRQGKQDKWAVTPVLVTSKVTLELLSAYLRQCGRFYLTTLMTLIVTEISRENILLDVSCFFFCFLFLFLFLFFLLRCDDPPTP